MRFNVPDHEEEMAHVSLIAFGVDKPKMSSIMNLKIFMLYDDPKEYKEIYTGSGSTLPNFALTTISKKVLETNAFQPYSPKFKIEADCISSTIQGSKAYENRRLPTHS